MFFITVQLLYILHAASEVLLAYLDDLYNYREWPALMQINYFSY